MVVSRIKIPAGRTKVDYKFGTLGFSMAAQLDFWLIWGPIYWPDDRMKCQESNTKQIGILNPL